MKTATGLTLLAIGAILTFAVTANTSVFNLHIAGIVIMLTGLAGLLIPRRSYTRLNRRLVQRRTRTWPNGSVVETRETSYPPYLMINPGAEPGPAADAVRTPDATDPGEEDAEVIDQLREE